MYSKPNCTIAIVLCIFFVQMCQSVDNRTMKEYKEFYKIEDLNSYLNDSDGIKDVGSEFAEDVQIILEKFDNNMYVTRTIMDLMDALAVKFDGTDTKITGATVKENISEMDYDQCWIVDQIEILQSLLLKQLPAERISGVINLLYVLNGDGTEKDLENALGYLYGTKARAMTPNPNIPALSSLSCTERSSLLTSFAIRALIDRITSLHSTKLNPKVTDDVLAIAQNFKYNAEIFHLISITKKLLFELEKKNSTVKICDVKDQNPWFKTNSSVQEIAFKIIDFEIILPTRVPVENFKDLLNLVRASFKIEGNDWRKALEYAYVPNYFKAERCN